MKYKVKKEMNLPELIEWALEKGMTYRTYFGSKGGEVYFDGFGIFRAEIDVDVYPKETFEVEFEEEITEETVIPKLAHYYVHSGMPLIATQSETSISKALKVYTKGEGFMNLAFYILNDDYSMTLIWKDGEMVE
ncbi:hypothetical protein [Staphylococcus chromogenes]|uniref:hypothetical protein n=1 Tax=Staphylococcus chromogenes TaxID=46126 RepID=UPI002884C08D|nr:hypothetical protein [Staphylococcus chromogenes]MDT0700385.1 hypothetical protein [Staphylococcus chromogenes]